MMRLSPWLAIALASCSLYLPIDHDGDEGESGCDPDGADDRCFVCDADEPVSPVCVDGEWQCPLAHCETACLFEEQDYFCVYGCGDDYSVAEICIAGQWQCPEGTQDGNDCPAGTCWGLPPSCCIDGQWHYPTCDSGSYECLPGSESQAGECEVACDAELRPTCVASCEQDPAAPVEPHCIRSELSVEDYWLCPEGTFPDSDCSG